MNLKNIDKTKVFNILGTINTIYDTKNDLVLETKTKELYSQIISVLFNSDIEVLLFENMDESIFKKNFNKLVEIDLISKIEYDIFEKFLLLLKEKNFSSIMMRNVKEIENIFIEKDNFNNNNSDINRNYFNDTEYNNEFINLNYRKLTIQDQLSRFIATYILEISENDYESSILNINSNFFGDIFYYDGEESGQKFINLIINPDLKNINFNLIFEKIKGLINNVGFLEFLKKEIIENDNKITFNIFSEEEIEEKVYECAIKNFTTAYFKYYKFSNIDELTEEFEYLKIHKLEKAELNLVDGNYFESNFKDYKTFFCITDGTSIRNLYIKSNNNDINLFSSNVREHIKDKLVDNGIKETIKSEPNNFLIYNNGLTIVCNDCTIENNKINLNKLSIVNGCQTTTILGQTEPEINLDSINIFCKIIKINFTEDGDLSENISIHSNSQKQIKNTDYLSLDKKINLFSEKFNLLSNNYKILIKRSDKIKKEFKSNRKIVIDLTKFMQFWKTIFYNAPGKSKNQAADCIKDVESVKKIFKKFQLVTDNQIEFTKDLIYILEFINLNFLKEIKNSNIVDEDIKKASTTADLFLLNVLTSNLYYLVKEQYLNFERVNKLYNDEEKDLNKILYEISILALRTLYNYSESTGKVLNEVTKSDIELLEVFKKLNILLKKEESIIKIRKVII